MSIIVNTRWQQHKNIVKNSFFLSVVDGIKLLLPFVAMPYIIRVCGVENYGRIIFAQSVMTYFSIVVNFGLNIFTVREVAKNVQNPTVLSQLASSFIALRLLLISLSFAALLVMLAVIPFMQQFKLLMLYAFIAVLAEAFTMTAFFQGLEKMHNIAVLQFVAVVFYLSTLFIFVRKAEDYELVVFLQSIGLLLASLLGVGLLCVRYKIRVHFSKWRNLWDMLKCSTPFAMSRIAVVVNSNVARLFAGIALGMHELAVLDIAQKISDAAMIPISIADQALYPHNAKNQDRKFATHTFWGILAMGIGCALLMVICTPYAVRYFGHGELNDAIPLTCLLSIKVVINALNLYSGTPVLVAFGYAKPFNMSIIYAAIITLLIYTLLYFTGILSLNAVAAVMIFDIIFITAYRLFYCVKYKLLFYNDEGEI